MDPNANPDQSELDAIFADIDGINDAPGPSSRPSPKSSSNDASKSKRRVVNVLMSDGEDDNGNKEESKTAGDKDDKEKKKRRPVVKLDEERLLGPNGFPALLAQYKRFKPTGKGNEAKDLQRLLQMYQLWSHKMYPKTQFRDTAQKIENLCRSRRMHAALSGWKNEPRKTSPKADDDTQTIDLDVEADNEKDSPEPAAPDEQPPPQDKGKGKAPRWEIPAPSATPDEWDLDAMIAEDEAARAELGIGNTPSIPQISTSTSAPISTHKIQKSAMPTQPEEDDWDMDALIAEVEGQEREEQSATVNVEEDVEPWNGSGANGNDEEHDIWDME